MLILLVLTAASIALAIADALATRRRRRESEQIRIPMQPHVEDGPPLDPERGPGRAASSPSRPRRAS